MGVLRFGVPEGYVPSLRDRLGLDCLFETGNLEGSEKLVLGGLAETIRRARPLVLCELSIAGRWLFGGEEGLRDRLYPDYPLFEVARGRLPRGYRLRRFDYARAEQFLCVPAERASMLRRVPWPWRGSRLRHG